MSSQSGISAEQELIDFLHNPSQGSQGLRIVTAGVSDDFTSVQLKGTYDSLSLLQSNLRNEPIYVFVKDLQKSPNQYAFASYVPDSSPVKLKMLYASTKNTLVRQIGGNSIGKQVLITDPADFQDVLESKDADPQQGAAMLTESERTEIEISQQQQRMKLGNRKLVSQNEGAPTSLVFDVKSGDFTINELLQQFNVVYCRIDLDTEQIQVVDKSNINESTQLKILPEHPSYTLYRNGSLNYFIYSCPSGSKVKERMVYASNRLGFINHLKTQDRLEFARVIEIGDPDDLELSLISTSSQEEQKQEEAEEASARSASSRKFNKPKGPGRRR
ncbi:Twinfilin-1 [Zygosaccharomyces mellis]|uniref:Twinfilin-1 n=1 Tax=Zygosaccharomyces mellis TaxID=42258 RepID=A0A4C2E8Q8_9SACH|nr:Twinfilin-1 [Zygosaccharomyces mellis]